MPNQDLTTMCELINLTLNHLGAFFHVETEAEGVHSSSHASANFKNIAHTSKDSF